MLGVAVHWLAGVLRVAVGVGLAELVPMRSSVRVLSGWGWAGVVACVGLVLGVCGVAGAQDLGLKAPPTQEMPVAIVNATIHTVDGDGRVIEDGFVLFREGLIVEVGAGERMFTADTVLIDGRGKHVWPGLVGAYTQIGLTEIDAVPATRDVRESGHLGVSPEARAITAVNPDSTLIPVARMNGVLTAGVFPSRSGWYDGGSPGIVPGTASVIRLEGWTNDEMVVLGDAGVIVSWPLSRAIEAWWMDRPREEQEKQIREQHELLRRLFTQARAYDAARSADLGGAVDVRLEALRPVVRGERPMFAIAADVDQIASAMDFAGEFGLRLVIVGGRDSALLADRLRETGTGVILFGPFNVPKRDDSPYDETYRQALLLERAGVRWCLASGQESWNERNLPYAAGMSAAFGLEKAAAVRSITRSAAELLGVGDRLGSIEPGKYATLLVTDGDVLEFTTRIERAFIDGREVSLENKHEVLRDKYLERYRQRGEIRRELP